MNNKICSTTSSLVMIYTKEYEIFPEDCVRSFESTFNRDLGFFVECNSKFLFRKREEYEKSIEKLCEISKAFPNISFEAHSNDGCNSFYIHSIKNGEIYIDKENAIDDGDVIDECF